jgi:hypothetical protein
MRTAFVPRPVVALVAVLAGGWACAAVLPANAAGSTIHACVNPKSGATRIVSAKARCRRGEKRMSWSTTGPQGPAGANGAAGAPGSAGAEGKAGAAVAYSAVNTTDMKLPAKAENLVIAKPLPPGNYVALAKLAIGAESTTKAVYSEVLCGLLYRPGLAISGESKTVDVSAWEAPLAEVSPGHSNAVSTITMQGTFSTTVTVTLAAECQSFEEGVEPATNFDELQAIGVSSIQ